MNKQKEYQQEIKKTMAWLADQDDTIFLGQAVAYGGTGMYDSLEHIDIRKKLEFPVAENLQMGVSIGLALNGFVPISIYPRWNFLLCAADQIVNHLDKFPLINSNCSPRVIVRVAVGSEVPVDPNWQHKGNFSDAFKLMCKTVEIIECDKPEIIFQAYSYAYLSKKSCIVVEHSDYGK